MTKIETSRLILRNFMETDFDDLYEYISDPEVVKFEPYKAMNKEETQDNLKWRISTDEMIAVELKETGKVIGNIYSGIREFESREIGYVFNKKFWGQGFAKEAAKAVIDAGFMSGVHRVFAECDPENESSWRLLEALGFVREGHFKQNVYFWKDENGQPLWKDTFVYSKLR